jgi:hypothetical protein
MRKRIPILMLATLMTLACAHTPLGRTYQTIGSVKIAVDTAMNVYADRVIDGKITDAQQAQVRKAFGEYTGTARAAAAVMRSTSDAAPPDMAAAAQALLALLEVFGVKTGSH